MPDSMMNSKPLVQFDQAGTASILSYDVPSPVSYFGTNVLELDVPTSYFEGVDVRAEPKPDLTLEEVRRAMLDGFTDQRLFPDLGTELSYFETGPTTWVHFYGLETSVRSVVVPTAIPVDHREEWGESGRITVIQVGDSFQIPVAPRLLHLTPEALLPDLRLGKRLRVHLDPETKTWKVMVLEPRDLRPRLAILETYRLTTFLGDYGAGRVVSTFSLLPGESTKITVSTYARTTSTRNETSTILDSYSNEAAHSFEDAVQSETSNRDESKRRDAWSVEASASASFGIASLKASAGYSGSAAASREQFAKHVTNAVTKSACRASNKRDIQVKQASSSTTEEGREDSVERQIHNLNTGRTLNFVFRQMNQEFITLLHLVDAQVAFIDFAHETSLRVVSLRDLDVLLDEVLAGAPGDAAHAEVRGIVRSALEHVFDHQDRPRSVIEERTYEGGTVKYMQLRSDLSDRFEDEYTVPGVILSAQRNVLRTDGLIVEALLGQSEGLDDYSKGLQDQQVRAKRLANEATKLEGERHQLALQILRGGDPEAARIYAAVFEGSSLFQPHPSTEDQAERPALPRT